MRTRAFVSALAVAALSAALVPAVGSAATPRIDVVGGDVYKVNKYAKSTFRFKKYVTVAKSGRTVKLVNKTNSEHTISVLKKSDLPRTKAEMDGCFEDGPCLDLFVAHEAPEDGGPPAKPVLDPDGDGGLSVAGDSIVFGPKGTPGDTIKFKLTADKGRTLNYFCAIHPWMQGKLKAN